MPTVVVPGGRHTLTPLVAKYLAEQQKLGRMKPTTAREASYRLSSFAAIFGGRPVNQLNRRAVEQWLGTIEHLAAGTRRTYLSYVKGFCGWMVRTDQLRRDPTAGLSIRKPRTVPRALAADRVSALFDVLPDERAEVIVSLMVQCGLRCCEIASARTDDYNSRDRVLFVTGKGGHQRMLPVPDVAAAKLDSYLDGRPPGGHLVRSLSAPWKGITPATVSYLVREWMEAAGVKHRPHDGVSAHALRHTAASDVLEAHGDLRAVQDMLGHVSLETTQIYLRHADLGRLRYAMEGRSYRGRDPTATALRGAGGRGTHLPQAPDPTEGHITHPGCGTPTSPNAPASRAQPSTGRRSPEPAVR